MLRHSHNALPVQQATELQATNPKTILPKSYTINLMPFNKSTIVNKLGFTLIELLITIALIGILSGIGIIAFQSAQQKGRDAKRKDDLLLVKKALENSKNDCTAGSYYVVAPSYGFNNPTLAGKYEDLQNALRGPEDVGLNYMTDPPNDPKGGSISTGYYYGFTTTDLVADVCPFSDFSGFPGDAQGVKKYVLRAKLENNKDPDTVSSYNQCAETIKAVSWPSGIPPISSPTNPYYYVCPD